jgi:hypothetical protein
VEPVGCSGRTAAAGAAAATATGSRTAWDLLAKSASSSSVILVRCSTCSVTSDTCENFGNMGTGIVTCITGDFDRFWVTHLKPKNQIILYDFLFSFKHSSY